MRRSIIFRVYDKHDNVIFAEVKNYADRTIQGSVKRHSRKLFWGIDQAVEIDWNLLDGEHKAEVWLDTTQGTMQEVS